MTISEVFLAIFAILLTIVCIIGFTTLGWYAVWVCCLSKFSFCRELFGLNTRSAPDAIQEDQDKDTKRAIVAKKLRKNRRD